MALHCSMRKHRKSARSSTGFHIHARSKTFPPVEQTYDNYVPAEALEAVRGGFVTADLTCTVSDSCWSFRWYRCLLVT